MANFPTSLPSATPATHGVAADEIRAIAGWPSFPPFVPQSGFWYLPAYAQTITNHGPLNTLVLLPMWWPAGTQVTQLGEWVNTGGTAGATRRLAIYADNGSFYPGALLRDCGTYDGTVTGFQSVTAFTATDISGLTWVGGVGQTAATTVVGINNNVPGISGGTGTPPTGTNVMSAYTETVAGALPATFTSTRTVTNGGPRVYVKIA